MEQLALKQAFGVARDLLLRPDEEKFLRVPYYNNYYYYYLLLRSTITTTAIIAVIITITQLFSNSVPIVLKCLVAKIPQKPRIVKFVQEFCVQFVTVSCCLELCCRCVCFLNGSLFSTDFVYWYFTKFLVFPI